MDEDKKEIIDGLFQVLLRTRACHNLISLGYGKTPAGDEVVTADFENGYVIDIDVTADSGCAMILDVVKRLM